MDRKLTDQLDCTEYNLLLYALYEELNRAQLCLVEVNSRLKLTNSEPLTPEMLGIPILEQILRRLGHGDMPPPPQPRVM